MNGSSIILEHDGDEDAALTSTGPRRHAETSGCPHPATILDADLLALSLKRALERTAVPLGRAAAALTKLRGWFTFGYARTEDYARERFGRSGRWLRDQAALGDALERFPELGQALSGSDGGRPIGKVAAISIGRVATVDSVGAWIDLAREVAVRDLKAAVAEARRVRSSWPIKKDEGADRESGRSRDRVADKARASGGTDPPEDISMRAKGSTEAGPERDDDDRQLVTMAAPVALRTSFDETFVLHRAVTGHESTVTSFVEGLVGEAHAGPRPPDVAAVPLRRSRSEGVVERALAKSTDLWACLAQQCEAEVSASASSVEPSICSSAALERFEDVSRVAGQGDAAELDQQIRTLIELENELERELGRLLSEMGRRGAWAQLMFAGVRHYAEQRLGLGRTTAEGRVRLARALGRFPRLREAYEEGRIGLEAAILVVRILGREPVADEVERAWIDRAVEATVKRLRDEARALGRRRVLDGADGEPRPMDDADWQRSLLQRPGDIRGRVHELGDRAAAAGYSDVFLRLRLPVDLARDFLAAVDASRRGLTAEVGRIPWDEPWPDASASASVRVARAYSVRCRRLPSWVGLLAMLEDFVNTWDDPRGMPRRRAEAVYARDGWRCSAPGCTSRRHLEDHHLKYLSRGGARRSLANRSCVCRFHHQRGEHGELASCRGEAPLKVVWRLGRKDLGVWFRNERRLSCALN